MCRSLRPGTSSAGTTGAVLAEFFQLLGTSKRDHDAAWQLLRSGAIGVIGLDDADLPELSH
jgi:hypothetical protein